MSDGDLKWTASAQAGNLAFGTLAIDMSGSNKFYWETKIDSIGSGIVIGLSPLDLQWNNTSRAGFYGYYSDGNKYVGTSASSYGASFTTNDIIGILAGNGTLIFIKNGSSQGDAFTWFIWILFTKFLGWNDSFFKFLVVHILFCFIR